MKIAVTGATGFVGHYVLAELERRSMPGVLIVRPNSACEAAHSKHLVVEMDIQNPPPNAFELMGSPDVLIHLAWAGLPNYKSLHHFETELPSQYRFLSGLVRSGLTNLVVAGTCFEYGMQSGALHEEMETRPTNPYGFAKDVLRKQLEYLKSIHPFALTWGRLFYLYGEGQAENSLWSQLKRAAEQGDEIFNMSGGEQVRDYLPVIKVAEYLVSFAALKRDVGIVNICSGNPITVCQLVEGWIKQHEWSAKPNLGHYPYPDYEPMSFWGDRTKLDRCLRAR